MKISKETILKRNKWLRQCKYNSRTINFTYDHVYLDPNRIIYRSLYGKDYYPIYIPFFF